MDIWHSLSQYGVVSWAAGGCFWKLKPCHLPFIYIYPSEAPGDPWLVGTMRDVGSGSEAKFATEDEAVAYIPKLIALLRVTHVMEG